MTVSEELREALLNLEDARNREAVQRQIAEALLKGLRVLVFTKDSQELFLKLFDVMRKPLDFEAAFVLTQDDKGLFRTKATSDTLFQATVWQAHSMFQRVIKGEPVSVFDTALVPEWCSQPKVIRDAVKSALHFSIRSSGREALFICTHCKKGHFSRDHLALAHRFSMLAIQALQKFETERKLASLEKKLETEAKLALLNQKLVESEKRLARAKKMEALGTLAGGVAHDLNNVLSGIVSYPDLLLMDIPEDSPLRKPILTIQKSGERAASIVQDLLTLARRGIVATQITNLNHIIESYLKSPECETLKKFNPEVKIQSDLDSSLLNILASPVHLSKSVMNLLSNAAESMPDGGNIYISTQNEYLDKPIKGYDDIKEGDYAVLTVSDTGIGISSHDIEKIFEPFYTKKVMGRSGTGLGMSVVWGTVKDHKGYINVVSSEGQGTTFSLYFPVTRKEIVGAAEKIRIEEYTGRGETILVVDDIKEQREIASNILKKLGYSVVKVSSGEEAIDYMNDNSADLLVLDMIMDPGIDGLETYRKILALHPGQKAIIASGFSETEHVRKTQKLGAGQYIKKPYTLEKIGLAVKKELER